MVAKRHKITNIPLFKKLWDINSYLFPIFYHFPRLSLLPAYHPEAFSLWVAA
jgi:hypothetical protein